MLIYYTARVYHKYNINVLDVERTGKKISHPLCGNIYGNAHCIVV